MKTRFRNAALLAVGLAATVLVADLGDRGCLIVGGRDAEAVVGRPLTPVSYAGVARRTSRRAVRRTAYAANGYYAAPAAAAAVVYSLPSGCVLGGGIYTCGSVRYRAYYQGATLVYQPL